MSQRAAEWSKLDERARDHEASRVCCEHVQPRVGWLSWPATALVALLLLVIRLYQRAISPALGARCRFSPSCSEYAAQSLKKHGLLKGFVRATWRVMRCNPFGGSGYDPP